MQYLLTCNSHYFLLCFGIANVLIIHINTHQLKKHLRNSQLCAFIYVTAIFIFLALSVRFICKMSHKQHSPLFFTDSIQNINSISDQGLKDPISQLHLQAQLILIIVHPPGLFLSKLLHQDMIHSVPFLSSKFHHFLLICFVVWLLFKTGQLEYFGCYEVLDFIKVTWIFHSSEITGVDSTWLHPDRLIQVGSLSKYFLKNLFC